MLEMMEEASTSRYTRFADGLAKVCAVMGCTVALELNTPSPATFLIGRPDTVTLYLSKLQRSRLNVPCTVVPSQGIPLRPNTIRPLLARSFPCSRPWCLRRR